MAERPLALRSCALPGWVAPVGGADALSSPTGALINHDDLLLQINPERELGDMSYKLGQVSDALARAPPPLASLCPVPRLGPFHMLTRKDERTSYPKGRITFVSLILLFHGGFKVFSVRSGISVCKRAEGV